MEHEVLGVLCQDPVRLGAKTAINLPPHEHRYILLGLFTVIDRERIWSVEVAYNITFT